MGRKLHYRPGSFYRVDDRTGFPQRAERTRKQWNNLIVDVSVYEPRQPQDMVKGVKDQQSVVDARPLSPAIFVGPLYVQTSAASTPQATVLFLESLAFISSGDALGVLMDDGSVFMTEVQTLSEDAESVTVQPPIPLSVASGNEVINYRQTYPVAGHQFILDESVLDGGDVLG